MTCRQAPNRNLGALFFCGSGLDRTPGKPGTWGVEWSGFIRISTQHDGAGKSLDKNAGKPGEGYQTESLTASSFPYQRAKRPILLQGGGWVGWDPFVLCV